MVIRTCENISQGTEITLPYTTGETYLSRANHLSGILLDPCDCILCTSDRADGRDACRKREALAEEFQSYKLKHLGNTDSDIPSRKVTEAHVQSIKETYRSNQTVLRPSLFRASVDDMQATKQEAVNTKRLDLTKLSIQKGFRALEVAGYTGLDTSLTGGGASRLALPVSKDCIGGCLINVDTCILLMAYISSSFVTLSETKHAERWFRAAWWGKY